MNWADDKHPVNSVNPHVGNTEPRQRKSREGVETRHGTTHTCKVCHAEKSDNEFYKKDRAASRLDSTCKSCRIIQHRQAALGVTEADYRAMYKAQRGKCGVCLRRIYSKRYKRFAVDHCHSSGKIRGLLCHNCNRALRMMQDNPLTLKRAAAWVEGIVRHSEQSETTGEAVPHDRCRHLGDAHAG